MSRDELSETLGALTDAVRAERTKLMTVRSTTWLPATAVVLTVGVGTLTVEIVKCPASCGADTTKTSLTGVMLGQAIVAVLAVVVPGWRSRRRRDWATCRSGRGKGSPCWPPGRWSRWWLAGWC